MNEPLDCSGPGDTPAPVGLPGHEGPPRRELQRPLSRGGPPQTGLVIMLPSSDRYSADQASGTNSLVGGPASLNDRLVKVNKGSSVENYDQCGVYRFEKKDRRHLQCIY